MTRLRNSLCASLATAGVALLMLAWSPDGQAQSGYYIVPQLALEEVYDDNIYFNSENEVDDFITRLSPQLDVGFDSETFRWMLSYRNDSEWYKDNSDLDSNSARRFGDGMIEYRPNRRWTFTGQAQYIYTNSAEDISLTPGGGIPGAVGREEAERLLFSGGANYQFNPNLTGEALITWINDDLVDLNENQMSSATIDFTQVMNPARSLLYGFEYRDYDFTSDLGVNPPIDVIKYSEDSSTAWIGLSQSLSETSKLEFRAGPRYSDDELEPYILFNWQREYATGNTRIDALWDETTLLGEIGIQESRSIQATWTHDFTADLQGTGSVGYAYLTGTGYNTDITSASLSAAWQFTPSFFLTAGYDFNSQLQDFRELSPGRITHNVVSLSITYKRPRREIERDEN